MNKMDNLCSRDSQNNVVQNIFTDAQAKLQTNAIEIISYLGIGKLELAYEGVGICSDFHAENLSM